MTVPKELVIEKLKLEIEFIERGGYNPSVRAPHEEPRVFRDSISCLNQGVEQKVEPCEQCTLMAFVPEHARELDEPCHQIPLNEKGETVASLQGDKDKLRAVLLEWLKATVARLERG